MLMYTRAAMNLIKFIWTCILADTCVAGIVTRCGPDAQNYIHDPYIVSPERVQYGSDVNLTCYILIEVKFIKFVSFTWKKNGERLIYGGDYEISSGSGSFVNSTYKYYTNTLTFKGTRRTAEGERYMCQVEVAVGSRSSLFKTDEYIFGQKVPSATTTTASEGEAVAIFPTWKLTDDVMGFWSPRDGVIATIHSISVYIWPNSRSKVKVSRMITSSYRKTVKLVICNATKEDAGRYYFRGFKRRVIDGTFNLIIAADRKSTKVTPSTEPSTEGHPEPETTAPASTTSASTQVDVTSNTVTVTSKHTTAATTTGTTPSTTTTVRTDHDVSTVVLYIIVGCCVLFIVLIVFIVAAIVLIRIKRQDFWNLRTRRSYITPMQNMPENIDSGGYAEIDDANIPEMAAGNLVQNVGNSQSHGNIPPVCGAGIGRERQQSEGSCRKIDKDDEYEEVIPLDAINSEEPARKQEKRTQLRQPDHDIREDITDENIMTLPDTCSHSDPTIPVADSSVRGTGSGDMTAAIININLFTETGFMTQDTDETRNAPVGTVDVDELSASVEIFPDVGMMTANTAGAEQASVEARTNSAESGPCGAAYNRYESLMPGLSVNSYTALETLVDIKRD